MKHKAIFPGSFDPITVGHEDILRRALPLFDEIIISIGENSSKKNLFSLEKRIEMMKELFDNEPKVSVKTYKGLTANFCAEHKVKYIIRGLRSGIDFEYEKTIANLNTSIAKELETVFLISAPLYSHISSSIVREILINSGDARQFVPQKIKHFFKKNVL